MLRTSEIPNNTKINLQTLIETFIPQLTASNDTKCQTCGDEREKINTLMHPNPTLILHENKVPDGNKSQVEIDVPERILMKTTKCHMKYQL